MISKEGALRKKGGGKPIHNGTHLTSEEAHELYELAIRAKFLQWCRDGGYSAREGCDCYGCDLRERAEKALRLFKGFAEHCKETDDG